MVVDMTNACVIWLVPLLKYDQLLQGHRGGSASLGACIDMQRMPDDVHKDLDDPLPRKVSCGSKAEQICKSTAAVQHYILWDCTQGARCIMS